ncbi:GDSL esterase/lipase [Populus alba x Populus x berolinensis]|uniref:GDSL esterase/lipase n=1 Tax=Populus alba x Populus x berolinensis TaxID=444605 RepID=A0AAD6VTX4_9ROSI|nr:GDSL esterase/lipase [Populus alba x Populus x berolinensis]
MSFALDRQRFIIMGIVSQTSVIFGDSLVDVGNNFYIKTFATPLFPNGIDFGNGYRVPSGRYSNARLVPDIIGQELGLKIFPPPYLAPTTVGDVLLNGVNYASSGSGILKATGESFGDRISLENQISYFEKTRKDITSNIGIQAAKKLLREAIYVLIIGTNDIRDNSNVVDSGAVLDTIISSLRSQLTVKSSFSILYKLGARKLVVGNCAPYGCIPYTRDEYGVKDGCVSAANQRAQRFEDAENACCSVVGAHGGIIPCSTISQVCSDRTKKVFWDPFHLTESAYLITAKHLLDGDLNYTSPMNFRQLLKDPLACLAGSVICNNSGIIF